MAGIDETQFRAGVTGILNRWPTVGLAVGVVRNGSLDFFYGHGVADIAANTAANNAVTQDTVFRIASVTKTFTAIAVMQLWEQGLIDLDAPANDYLRAFRLEPAEARFGPATVRHLLTHTAGIREVLHPSGLLRMRDLGEAFAPDRALHSLAEYYDGALRLDAEPGTRFTYTNHGYATLGQIVADVSGEPLDEYLRHHIFEPLGMPHTGLGRPDRTRSDVATGYELRSGGAAPVCDFRLVTAGAGGIYSSPRDMAQYLAALLGGGTNQHGSVLKPETLADMFRPHHQPDPRIPGIGLAFFRTHLGGHLAVEHDGILPGFDSAIVLAPGAGVALMAFATGAPPGLHWLAGETDALLQQLLGVPEALIRTDIAQQPQIWEELCGWYKFSTRLTDPPAFAIGAGAEVLARRGRLVMRFLGPTSALGKGFPLHPDDEHDPYVFRVPLPWLGGGTGTGRVVFSREPGMGVTAMHFDFAPISLPKQPAATNPRRWFTGAIGVAALAGSVAVTAALRRRMRKESP